MVDTRRQVSKAEQARRLLNRWRTAYGRMLRAERRRDAARTRTQRTRAIDDLYRWSKGSAYLWDAYEAAMRQVNADRLARRRGQLARDVAEAAEWLGAEAERLNPKDTR